MKNKLHISESEMKRILSLHRERIQKERQLLKEYGKDEYTDQGQATGDILGYTAAGSGVGAGIGAMFGGVGAVPGAIIGAGVGALVGYLQSGGGAFERVKKMFEFCRKNGQYLGRPVNSIENIRDIADNIRGAIGGWGSTDENAIRLNLKKLKTIPDFCMLRISYQKRHGQSLFDALDGDIDQDQQWQDFVWLPLSELAGNSKKITDPEVLENAKKCGWGNDVEGYKNSKWRCPKNKDVIENAKKCGWGNDIQGYKNSGWRCPKNKTPNPNPPNPNPIPGGGGYEFDYEKIMKLINEKCKGVVPGGGGNNEIENLNWNATDTNQQNQQNQQNQNTKVTNSTFDKL